MGCGLVLSYCVRYYETIAGGFYSQGVTDYPRGCKSVTIVAYYLASVSVLIFHYHSTLIKRSCLACAGVFVGSVNIPDAAALICVNVCLCSLCVVGYLSLSDKMKKERIYFALCLYLVLVFLF